jgi:hypothetical protein
MGFGVQTAQRILQKWDKREARLRPRMEITGQGLTLGAETVLAKMARDEGGGSTLTLDDEPRVMAPLATAYERPIGARVVAKIERAFELWNEGDKALAHIHLAHADLPSCSEERALRLFAAHELLNSGVTPEALLKAQGFDSAALAFLKYSPDQPRVPAGSGRESGRWTYHGAAGPQESDAAGSEDGTTSEDIIEGRSSSSSVASNEKERGQQSPKEPPTSGQQLSFTGTLIDKRYDEVLHITHCTYSTPLGTFTIERPGFLSCPDTMPVPPGLF